MSDIMKITVISDTHGIIDENIVPHLKNSDIEQMLEKFFSG